MHQIETKSAKSRSNAKVNMRGDETPGANRALERNFKRLAQNFKRVREILDTKILQTQIRGAIEDAERNRVRPMTAL